jgi:hypothetical protein
MTLKDVAGTRRGLIKVLFQYLPRQTEDCREKTQ